MFMKKKKGSLAKSFSTISLLIILFVKIILLIIFYSGLRTVVKDLTEINAMGNVAHSQELIVSALKGYEQTLMHTSIGIRQFFRQQNPSAESVTGYLQNIKEKTPSSIDIYFSNNNAWNHPNGFFVYTRTWEPPGDYDNTARSWFVDAKNAQGEIAYSEPYVDSDTRNIVITLSKTVYDDANDLGVIAKDFTVNSLGETLNSLRGYLGQEVYIINPEGYYITHEDINQVMIKNFFDDKNTGKYREAILNSENFNIVDKNIFIYSSVIPQTEWHIVSVIPAQVIFARLNVFTAWLLIFSVGMFICIAVILIVFVHKNITVPLTDMLNVTNSLAKKDYDIDIPKFRNDEIGDIQKVLLTIRDNLKSNIDSLQDHINKEK